MKKCIFCENEMATDLDVCPTCGKDQAFLILEDQKEISLEMKREEIRKEFLQNSILRYFSYFFVLLGLLTVFKLEDKLWVGGLCLVVGLLLSRLAKQGWARAKNKQEAINRILGK